MSRQRQRTDVLTKIAAFLLYGFSFFGKPFSYLAIPLGGLLVLDPRPLLKPMYTALTRKDPLSSLSWALLSSLMYGICGIVYGMVAGYPPLVVFQIFTFTLYPFYLFAGIWGGIHKPDFVRRYIRFFAWFGAVLTPINFILMQRKIPIPGSDQETVIAFGSGLGVLLGIFAFETKLSRYWFPIAVFSFSLIANQVRADWLGFGIALVIWGAATKKLNRVLGMAAAIIVLLVIGFVADVHLPAVPGRGGEISTRETVARAVSAVDPKLAMEYSNNASAYAGTVGWRTNWWRAIREAVSESPQTMIFGLGYGYPIKALVPGNLKKSDIRSPHNIFYFVLSYSGIVGVVLFFWIQIAVVALLWRTYKRTGQIYGLAFYVSVVVGAFFGNFLETPQGAIPTYLLTGFCIGPLFLARNALEESADIPALQPTLQLGRRKSAIITGLPGRG